MKNAALSRQPQSIARIDVQKVQKQPIAQRCDELVFQPTVLAKSLSAHQLQFLQRAKEKGGVAVVSQGAFDKGINWMVLLGVLQASPLQVGPLCEPSGEIRLELTPLANQLMVGQHQ